MSWAPELGLSLSLAVDGRAAALLVLVAVVSAASLGWTVVARESGWRRTLVLLAVFVVAVSALLTAADVITYIVAWEATSILSYLLVGQHDDQPDARRSARTTLVVTGLGGVILLIGLLVLSAVAGDTSFAAIRETELVGTAGTIGAYFVLVGAATKSAQVPFHGWLLGASTAPSPASALLHAAALVIAGVDALLRIGPAATDVAGWSAVAVTVGLATLVWTSWIAVREDVAKVVLAGTTAAQMGLGFALAGLGKASAASAAVAVLLIHGLYKSALFLLAGNAKLRTGDKTLRGLHVLAERERTAKAALWGGALLLAGAPPLAGWISKEAAVSELWKSEPLTAVPLILGTALGVWTAARLLGLDTAARATSPDLPDLAPRSASVLAPAGLVGIAVVLLAPGALAALVADVAEETTKLVIWPGFGGPLAVSVTGLVLGVGMIALTVPAITRSAPELVARALDAALDGASSLRDALFRLSRPALIAAVAAPAVLLLVPLALIAAAGVPATDVATSPTQAFVTGILLLGVIGTIVLRSQLGAVIAVGVVGYALAGLFAVHGAPDLVVTQAIVETVIVVVFVAVLRRLPDRPVRPARPRAIGQAMRAAAALGAGVTAAATAYAVSSPDAPRELVGLAEAAAVPVGAGKNVVNVVLTDFRALDTVGELTVLLLAAIGVMGMASLKRHELYDDDVRPPMAWTDSNLLVGAAPIMTRLSVVIGLHLLAIGHDQPGGGFAGGLVIAAGLALHRVATGYLPDSRLLRRPPALLGSGLLVVAAVMLAPLLVGGVAGDMGSVTLNLGPVAQPKLTSAFVLDIGVMLIVIGVVLAALRLQDQDAPEAAGLPEPTGTGARA